MEVKHKVTTRAIVFRSYIWLFHEKMLPGLSLTQERSTEMHQEEVLSKERLELFYKVRGSPTVYLPAIRGIIPLVP